AIPPGPPTRIAPPPIPRGGGQYPRIKPIIGTLRKFPFLEFDLTRGWQGVAEILEKSGFTELGQAIRNHFDQFRVYTGMTQAPIRAWAKGISKAELKQAHEEFKNYWQSVDERWQSQAAPGAPVGNASEAIYNAASPKGRELIDLWKQLADQTGDIAVRNRLE